MRAITAALCAACLLLVAGSGEPAQAAVRTHVHDADVVWDTDFVVGAVSSLHVSLWGASSLTERVPVSGSVEVVLAEPKPAEEPKATKKRRRGSRRKAGAPPAPPQPKYVPKTWPVWSGKADAKGQTDPSFRVPTVRRGTYRLIVKTRSTHGTATLTRMVEVRDRTLVQVRTDRPVYKPGQTIRWRATLVNGTNGRPVARAKAVVSILDPRRTRVWRGEIRSDATGQLSGALPLAEDLRTGKYTVLVVARRARGEQTVKVRPFELPPFFAAVDLGQAVYPVSSTVTGFVSARYPYGEPVRGEVSVVAKSDGQVLWSTNGTTDETGRFPVSFKLPAVGRGEVAVSAVVTDGARRRQNASATRPWGNRDVTVVLVPEVEQLAPGVAQTVNIVTVDDLGRPVPATLSVKSQDANLKATQVVSTGAAQVSLLVPTAVTREVSHSKAKLAWLRLASGVLKQRALKEAEKMAKRSARAVLRCVTRRDRALGIDAAKLVEVVVAFKKGKLRRVSATSFPFPSRRDFKVPVTGATLDCMTQSLKTWAGVYNFRGAAKAEVRFAVARVQKRTKESHAPRSVLLQVSARLPDGRVIEHARSLPVAWDGKSASLRVDSPVLPSGGTIVATATWPKTVHPVVASLVRGSTALVSVLARRDATGHLTASLKAPPSAFGLATVRFSEVSWTTKYPHANTTNRSVNVYIKPRVLAVELTLLERVKPGTPVLLNVGVRDAKGKPVKGVGLAASVVDERVLALGKPQVSLLAALTGPDLKRAKYAGLAFREHALKNDPTTLDRLLSQTILQSLGLPTDEPSAFLPAAKRWRSEASRMNAAYQSARAALLKTAGAVVKRAGPASHTMIVGLDVTLEPVGKWSTKMLGPWGRRASWEYLRVVRPAATALAVGVVVSEGRLAALERFFKSRKSAAKARFRRASPGSLEGFLGKRRQHLATDAWGQPFVVIPGSRRNREGMGLVSPGPDGVLGTKDDFESDDVLWEYTVRGGGYGGSFMGSATVGGAGGGAGGRARGGVGLRRPTALSVAIRKRFDATVLWSVGERTGADGSASFRVPMADSITGWQVEVEAISPDGGFGRGLARIETFLARSVSVHLPDGLSVGDRYTSSVVVANHARRPETLTIVATARGAVGLEGGVASRTVTLEPGATLAVPLKLRGLSAGSGTVRVVLTNGAGAAVDALEKTATVQAQGPLERRLLSTLVLDGRGTLSLDVPPDADAESVRARMRVFRGASDAVLDGLEDMLKEPYGCFEQTSSTTYPNLLVLRLLKSVPGTQGVQARARSLVGKGYQRLLNYEVRGGGFSLFGSRPASRVLTAYGLMEFDDMAAVYPVDRRMINRTRRWLARQQLKDGSFRPDKGFDESRAATTAYISWALAQSGKGGHKAARRGLSFLRARAAKWSERPYVLALWANAEAALGGSAAKPLAMLERHGKVAPGGGLGFAAKSGTLFYGWRRTAMVETTALAAMAGSTRTWAKGDPMRWLWGQRDLRYGWGSTQATVLALRAAVRTEAGHKPPRSGRLAVALDGKASGRADLAAAGVPTFKLKPVVGKRQTVAVSGAVKGRLNAEVRVSWRSKNAAKPRSQGLVVHLKASRARVEVGGRVKVTVAVMNPGKEAVPMPTVVVPVPPGFRVVPKSLKRLKSGRRVARFEDRGDRIHLYLTEIGAGAVKALAYQLEATTVCDVLQRGAEVYAYYEPEVRGRSGAFRLKGGPAKE